MNNFAKQLLRIAAVALFAWHACLAGAQGFPHQSLRWIVPYAPGGGSDVVARTVSAELSKHLGQPLIVDNRPGGGTIIGMNALLGFPADGYSIATADVGTLAFNPSLYAKLPYSTASSFVYVGGIMRNAFVLATRADLPVGSLADFVALAKRQPGRLTYASAGAGSPHHIGMELLQQRASIKLIHVPYKGGAPAVQDLLSGHVDAMLLDLPGGLPFITSGKLKILGVASPQRVSMIPDVPTLTEGGLDGVVAYSWQLLVARSGTPQAALDRLAADLRKALEDPAVRAKLQSIGAEAMPMSPAAATEFVKSEGAKWSAVIKVADVKLD